MAWFAPAVSRPRALEREATVGFAWRRLDWVALGVTLILVLIGCVMIYSAYEATRPDQPETLLDNTVFRQALFAVIGLTAYFVLAAIDYHLPVALYKWVYAGIVCLLVFTLAMGEARFGAQSWFQLAHFDLQPAELCKVLLIIVLAKVLDSSENNLESIRPFVVSIIMVGVPAALIYAQPDFGTAVVLLAMWAVIVVLAGVRWRHILLVAGAGLAAIPAVWSSMHDYQRDRVLEFLFPGSDPTGASYNITQALIGIGSGGWWGKGLLQGSQSQLHFLRVRHTDFIFSVFAEEFGFLGCVLLVFLFALLIFRILRVAATAPDPSGRLIAVGVAAMIFIQTFINLGMNVNLLPVTGLTLPLVSYGGSSLVTTLMALGMVQSVALRTPHPEPTVIGS